MNTIEMSVLKDVMLLNDFQDRRGRTYDRAEITEQLSKKAQYFGELCPATGDLIDMNRVSHVVENITITDRGVIGDIRIIDTLSGKIAEGLLTAGINLRSSIRAVGDVTNHVVSNLSFITFDLEDYSQDLNG